MHLSHKNKLWEIDIACTSHKGCHNHLPFRGGKLYWKLYKTMCKWDKKCQTGRMKGFWKATNPMGTSAQVRSSVLPYSASCWCSLPFCPSTTASVTMIEFYCFLPCPSSLNLVIDFWHPFSFHAYVCFRQQQLHGINPLGFIEPLFKAVLRVLLHVCNSKQQHKETGINKKHNKKQSYILLYSENN